MELSSHEEAETPVPINSAFVGLHNMHVQHGHAHMIHHHHHSHDPSSSSAHNLHNIIPLNNNSNGTSTITAPILEEEDDQPHQRALHCNINDDDDDHNNDGNMYDDDDVGMMVKKKKIKYKECQKNHAASMGGNARDGCGEFMASGEEGSLEYFICSACNCHRNFHKKQVEGDEHLMQSQFYPSNTTPHLLGSRGRKVILGTGGGTAGLPRVPFSRSVAVNMPYTLLSDQYDHHHHHGNDGGGMMMMMHHHHHNNNDDNNKGVKKRFRTKFSQEQKEKMYEFAEKVGWKIQKQEESVVQQFCQQIGIKRRVLKIWMHNNKHSMAKNQNHNHININNNSY